VSFNSGQHWSFSVSVTNFASYAQTELTNSSPGRKEIGLQNGFSYDSFLLHNLHSERSLGSSAQSRSEHIDLDLKV